MRTTKAEQRLITLVTIINQRAEENKLFWVAGLAREAWPALLPVLEQLHPSAAMAVEHYAALGA